MTRSTTAKNALKATALLGLLLPVCALTGCNSGGGAEVTKQDEANFKGGPMPASAAAAMQKSAADQKGAAPK